MRVASTATLSAGNITNLGLIYSGAGSPEGVTTAGVGSIYMDTTNGWLWQKESGTGNTGWRIIGASGTYTPTATIVSNLDSVTPNRMEWMRIGNVVFVAGSVGIDPTAPGIVSYRITLPIASNFTLSSQLSGVCVTTSASVGNFVGDATNDAASVVAINSLMTAYDHIFTFGYEVV